MTTGDGEAIREAIRDWVHQSVGATYPLTDETDLIGDGVLTSLQNAWSASRARKVQMPAYQA